MATLEGLSLSISADVKDLLKGLGDGKKNIQDFVRTGEASLTTLGDAYKVLEAKQKVATNPADIKRYTAALKEIDGARKGLINVANDLPGVAKGANQAGQSLTSLGRIAQDAPFGFIGIQNNINPLLESFQRLKVETGSTKDAFKSLLSGLGGAAGIGLAVSLATSALTVLTQQGFFKSTDAAKEAKKANDEFKKSLKEVEQGALATGVKLQGFVDIAKNGNLPLEQRNQALKEANKIFGEYGEKVTLANVATEKITEQTKLFTNALVAQAIATKFADKIADLEIKKKEAQIKLNADVISSNKQLAQSKALENAAISGGTGGIGGLGNVSENAKVSAAQSKVAESSKNLQSINLQLNESQKLFNETVAESTSLLGTLGTKEKEVAGKSGKSIKTFSDIIADFRKEVAGLQAQLGQGLISSQDFDESVVKQLTSTIGKLGEIKAPIKVQTDLVLEFNEQRENVFRNQIFESLRKIDVSKDRPVVVKKPVKVEPFIVELNKFVFDKSEVNDLNIKINDALKSIGSNTNLASSSLQSKFGKDFSLTSLLRQADANPSIYLEQLRAAYAAINTEVDAQNAGFKQIIVSGFNDAFTGIGNAISAGIQGQNFGASLFSGLFDTLGDSLQAYGKQIITTSTLLKTLQKALKVGNFGGSLIVGIGLVALGSLTKGLAGGLKLADGGFVSGRGSKTSDSIPANLSRGEFVVKAAAVDKFGVGFLNSINNMNMPSLPSTSIGVGASEINTTGSTVMVDGEFRISGDSLRLLLARNNQTFLRNT